MVDRQCYRNERDWGPDVVHNQQEYCHMARTWPILSDVGPGSLSNDDDCFYYYKE